MLVMVMLALPPWLLVGSRRALCVIRNRSEDVLEMAVAPVGLAAVALNPFGPSRRGAALRGALGLRSAAADQIGVLLAPCLA